MVLEIGVSKVNKIENGWTKIVFKHGFWI